MKTSLYKKQFRAPLIQAVSIAWGVCHLSTLNAQEYYFQPSYNLQVEYDDNKQLKTERFNNIDTSSYGVINSLKAKVGARSDRYDIALDNQVKFNRYESEFNLDSDDYFIDLNASYNYSLLSRFGLTGSYIRDTTLSSELEGDGTGIVQDNIRRQRWSITPDWSYLLSESLMLQASYTHSETEYAESTVGNYVDYTIDNLSLNFRQQWTALFTNTLSLSAMSFDIPKIGSGVTQSSRETLEYTINLGAEYQFLPTWSASLSVGQRFTNTETNQFVNTPFAFTTKDDVKGFVFAFTLDKQFETGQVSISYNRSTSAQGDGRLLIRDVVNGRYIYKFTEKLSFNLFGELNENSTSGSVDDGRGRTYYTIYPTLIWRLNRQSSLKAGYRYRNQVFERNNEKATSNAVMINLNYQWDKFATQR